ncbi:hypothetical protein FACS189434_11440 [Bacteroidia bacterium]|nr:hypothetical protein FACS189434_11440 [Bacteroidia bacterium]
MKKLISCIIFTLCFSAAFAADYAGWSHTGTAQQIITDRTKALFVFNDLTAKITYTTDLDTIETAICQTYENDPVELIVDTVAKKITFALLQTDAKGYIININNSLNVYVYVFNYNAYMPTLHSPELNGADCNSTAIKVKIDFTPMAYTLNTETGIVERNFTLKYKTLRWNEEAEKLEEIEAAYSIDRIKTPYNNDIEFDSIFIDTKFTLSGDQFANPELKSESDVIAAVKPIIKCVGELAPREADNERDKGDEKARRDLEGSAPVQVNLRAYANTPLARDFTWFIYDVTQPTVPISYSREQNFNLTFRNFGKYVARVTTTTADGCVVSDSITITVTESEIDIPNVFTPNGDGINDKFCVAFKSIIKYNMWVYNRWGRLVFKSNSPDNCWDGYIGNNKAASGAYFYKIEATGADGKTYKRAGDINLLR